MKRWPIHCSYHLICVIFIDVLWLSLFYVSLMLSKFTHPCPRLFFTAVFEPLIGMKTTELLLTSLISLQSSEFTAVEYSCCSTRTAEAQSRASLWGFIYNTNHQSPNGQELLASHYFEGFFLLCMDTLLVLKTELRKKK